MQVKRNEAKAANLTTDYSGEEAGTKAHHIQQHKAEVLEAWRSLHIHLQEQRKLRPTCRLE